MFGIYSNWGPTTDQPDRANVLTTDTVGGLAGLFANVSTVNVRDGIFWGANGTQYEGSLAVTGETGIFFLRRK